MAFQECPLPEVEEGKWQEAPIPEGSGAHDGAQLVFSDWLMEMEATINWVAETIASEHEEYEYNFGLFDEAAREQLALFKCWLEEMKLPIFPEQEYYLALLWEPDEAYCPVCGSPPWGGCGCHVREVHYCEECDEAYPHHAEDCMHR